MYAKTTNKRLNSIKETSLMEEQNGFLNALYVQIAYSYYEKQPRSKEDKKRLEYNSDTHYNLLITSKVLTGSSEETA
jgi:hypothetical protein